MTPFDVFILLLILAAIILCLVAAFGGSLGRVAAFPLAGALALTAWLLSNLPG